MGLRPQPDRQQLAGPSSRLWWVLVAAAFITSACQALASPSEFSSANLLILDPVDSNTVSTDMLAVFSYQSLETISLRIDVLDFSVDDAPSLLILLDTFPGSTVSLPDQIELEDRWDIAYSVIPDQRLNQTPADNSKLIGERRPAAYDPRVDTIQINIPLEVVHSPGPYTIAIVSMDTASGEAMDTIGPVHSDNPPPKPIPLILTFWNVFPSATPGQAQRSWDGAHSGPAGERFGLRHLLEAAHSYHVPVVLADIKQPQSLAGLQLLDAVPMLIELEKKALISLPDVLPQPLCLEAARLGWPDWVVNQIGIEAQNLDFPPSSTLTCSPGVYNEANMPTSSGYRSLLIHASKGMTAAGDIQSAGSIIPLFQGITAQSLSFDGGLSLDLRKQLTANIELDQAHSAFLLSSNFQESFWGDPRSVDDAFHWIAAHPWIQPISLEQFNRSMLRELNLVQPGAENLDTANILDLPLSAINLGDLKLLLDPSDSKALSTIKWQILYDVFTSPICQAHSTLLGRESASLSDCEELEDRSRRGLQILSFVHTWEKMLPKNAPEKELQSLEDSLNRELATSFYMDDHWFAAVDSEKHQLLAIFANSPDLGAIPLIWDPPVQELQMRDNSEIEIEFFTEREGDLLRIEFQAGDSPGYVQLPIYLSPNQIDRAQECLRWNLETGIYQLGCSDASIWKLEIDQGIWSLDSVLDSPARWNVAEDPNREMPAGHFLPIPYGLLSVDFEDKLSLSLTVIE